MGYGDARVRGNPERWKTPRRRTLKLSSSLRLHLLYPRLLHPLVLSTCFSFLFFFSVCPSLSLSLSLSSFSISLIPISSFSSFPSPAALFRRLNQPTEETTRRGGARGSRRGRRGWLEEAGERERAVDEHKHGILSDVDVYVNAEYLMGCQKQSL